MSPTHYETLEVSESATQEEIKGAYRRLAKKYHPDRNKKKGAEEKFKEINLAYQVLGDPGRRQSYDATQRASSFSSAAGNAPPPPPPPGTSRSTAGQASPPSPPPAAQGAYRYFFFFRGLLVGGALVGAVFLFVLIFYAACRASSAKPMATAGAPEPARVVRAVEAPRPVPVSAGPPPVILDTVPVPSSPERRVNARLEPIAYSYPKNEWAIRHPYLGSGLPHVQRFSFYNWLNWGAGMQWDGSFVVSGHELTLVIENLQLLDKPDDGLAKQFDLTERWSDVGVGSHVELQGAVFEDHLIAKDILIFRTFAGDTPPPRIEKSFRIIPVPLTSEPSTVHLRGEWRGSFGRLGRSVPFVMRLEQNGNEVFGVAIENDAGSRRRTTVRGWVIGSTVTFLKRGGDATASYISPDSTSKDLRGTWERRKDRGLWQAEWKGDFTDSVDDLPTMISNGNQEEPTPRDTSGADRSEVQSSPSRDVASERDHSEDERAPRRREATERDRSRDDSRRLHPPDWFRDEFGELRRDSLGRDRFRDDRRRQRPPDRERVESSPGWLRPRRHPR